MQVCGEEVLAVQIANAPVKLRSRLQCTAAVMDLPTLPEKIVAAVIVKHRVALDHSGTS